MRGDHVLVVSRILEQLAAGQYTPILSRSLGYDQGGNLDVASIPIYCYTLCSTMTIASTRVEITRRDKRGGTTQRGKTEQTIFS